MLDEIIDETINDNDKVVQAYLEVVLDSCRFVGVCSTDLASLLLECHLK